jgi:hypothetical protein
VLDHGGLLQYGMFHLEMKDDYILPYMHGLGSICAEDFSCLGTDDDYHSN